MSDPLLQLTSIQKSFGGVEALTSVSLHVEPGETIGLIGENGAGKSTLIKILSGVFPADSGTFRWHGELVNFQSPHDALISGIATIHQELAYCGHLTVAENLMLAEPWPRHRWGGVDWTSLHREATQRLRHFDINIPSSSTFAELSSAQKQEIAIARALQHRAQLVILDEPSASLSEPEVASLFARLQKLRAEGVAIIYVSHRLDEILQLTERILTLRDGYLVADYPTPEATVGRMIKDMVGRPVENVFSRTYNTPIDPPLLKLRRVSRSGMFHQIDLTVRSGEVVGLAGLVGAGRSELARAIYGLYPIDSGDMTLCHHPWKPQHPREALRRGLVYLPEERKRQGLVNEHSLADSISIGFNDLLARFGRIPRQDEANRVRHAMQAFDVRAKSPHQPVGTLSGGNQQKALLARWLERDPKVILLDEPTRGVDVGAKAAIHELIDQLATDGRAVLLISSDLPELLAMSDRVVVIHRGSVQATLEGDQMTQENVIRAASGLWNSDDEPTDPSSENGQL